MIDQIDRFVLKYGERELINRINNIQSLISQDQRYSYSIEIDRLGFSYKRSFVPRIKPKNLLNVGIVKNLRRSLSRLRKILIENNDLKVMITLTYKENIKDDLNDLSKKHLNLFLTNLRYRYKNLKYIWVKEFQKRGAIHYHILVNVFIPKSLVSFLWKYGFTRVEYIRKDVTNYMSKYLSKMSKNEGLEIKGRVWGSSRNINRPLKRSFRFSHRLDLRGIILNFFSELGVKVLEQYNDEEIHFYRYIYKILPKKYDEIKDLMASAFLLVKTVLTDYDLFITLIIDNNFCEGEI